MDDRDGNRAQRIASGAFWVVLSFACPPLVPLLVVARALWRRARGTLRPSRLGFMTTPGRWVYWSVAFVGSEAVALDVFANSYFNAVDEHAASVLGVFVLAILGLILCSDLVARETIDAFRKIAART